VETGVPISTSDRTAQSTLYYTPHVHTGLSLYDGTSWKVYTFAEVSLALSSLTSGKNYDVFVYDNAGTLTLELSAAWSSDTARTDALTTQDGVTVKNGSTTRRWLGTIRTTATTTTEDSAAKRFVWNAQNRVARPLLVTEATASWTYGTASYRQARASSANQVEGVVGAAGASLLDLTLHQIGGGSAGSAGAIGEDSTTTPDAGCLGRVHHGVANVVMSNAYRLTKRPGLGYHKWVWLENGIDGASTTFYGTNGDYELAGMNGTLDA
jgi:hypothetical protein